MNDADDMVCIVIYGGYLGKTEGARKLEHSINKTMLDR